MDLDISVALDQLYKLAEIIRGYNPDDAKKLRWMAEVWEKHPDLARVLGTFGGLLTGEFPCPYCGDDPEKNGTMRVVKLLCSSGRDYAAGYRTQWRCDTCGEMEIR
jgi:hypothetical protein